MPVSGEGLQRPWCSFRRGTEPAPAESRMPVYWQTGGPFGTAVSYADRVPSRPTCCPLMALKRNVVVEHPLAERLAEYYGIDRNLEDVGAHCDMIRAAIQQGDLRLVGALWAAALQLYFRCFTPPWDRLTGQLTQQLPPLHKKLETLRSRYYAHAVCELEDNRVTTVVPAGPPPDWTPTVLGRSWTGFGGFIDDDTVNALEELASEVRAVLQPEILQQEAALLEALRRERTVEDWKNATVVEGKSFDWMRAERPRTQLGRLRRQARDGKS